MIDSKDRRTKRQKLQDMANQTDSPNEAEIARRKLAEMAPPEPPRRTVHRVFIMPSGIIVDNQTEFTVSFSFTWEET